MLVAPLSNLEFCLALAGFRPHASASSGIRFSAAQVALNGQAQTNLLSGKAITGTNLSGSAIRPLMGPAQGVAGGLNYLVVPPLLSETFQQVTMACIFEHNGTAGTTANLVATASASGVSRMGLPPVQRAGLVGRRGEYGLILSDDRPSQLFLRSLRQRFGRRRQRGLARTNDLQAANERPCADRNRRGEWGELRIRRPCRIDRRLELLYRGRNAGNSFDRLRVAAVVGSGRRRSRTTGRENRRTCLAGLSAARFGSPSGFSGAANDVRPRRRTDAHAAALVHASAVAGRSASVNRARSAPSLAAALTGASSSAVASDRADDANALSSRHPALRAHRLAPPARSPDLRSILAWS